MAMVMQQRGEEYLARTIFILSFLLIECSAFALIYPYYTGPRSTALAGSGIGAITVNESLYLNPGALGLLDLYSIDANVKVGKSPRDGVSQNIFSATAVDGKTSFIRGGVGVRQVTESSSPERKEMIVDGVLGYKLNETLGVGIGATYVDITASGGIAQGTGTDLRAGALWLATDWLTCGITYYGLLASDLQMLPARGVVGLRAQIHKQVWINLDGETTFAYPGGDESGARIGMEIDVRNGVAIRAGYAYEPIARNNRWAVGGSWTGPKIAVFYAYDSMTDNGLSDGHQAGLRIFF
jgi:hypothetical protein